MADTTITITIPEAQWSTVQAAFATDDGNGNAVTIDDAYIKQKLLNVLTGRVRAYDREKQAVSYSTFAPS